MRTVVPDLFGVTPWAWFLVPVLCLLLIHFGDQTGRMRVGGGGLIGTSLGILALIVVIRWRHVI